MITQDKLKELFEYNPDTGDFTRRVAKGRAAKGSIAGSRNSNGYVYIKIDKISYSAHRLAFLYMEGRFPEEIDHINRIRWDNRWNNLREATHQQNCRNRNTRSTSGYLGIHWDTNSSKWKVEITNCIGVKIYGGLFPYEELELAINKANELRAQHLGMDSRQELFKGYICRREDLDK